MCHLNVVHIFRGTVARMAHVADDITGCHQISFLQPFRIRVILAKVCIIIVALSIQAADADSPAAVLIPAKGFHITGLDTDYRGPGLTHHVMSQMSALISVTPAHPEIIVMGIFESLCQRKESLQSVSLAKAPATILVLIFFLELPYHSIQYRPISFPIIGIVFQIVCQFLNRSLSLCQLISGLFQSLQGIAAEFPSGPGSCISQKFCKMNRMSSIMRFHIPVIGLT